MKGVFITNLKVIFFTFLFFLCIISGCSQQNSQSTIDSNNQTYDSATDKAIEEFIEKYAAVDYTSERENLCFSAEYVDRFKGKNIYISPYSINDIFYFDDELFMYAEDWNDDRFYLKITPEQYSKIKTMSRDYPHIIFTFDNMEPAFPTLKADFYFNASSQDDFLADYDMSMHMDSQITYGTLIDIIEIK